MPNEKLVRINHWLTAFRSYMKGEPLICPSCGNNNLSVNEEVEDNGRYIHFRCRVCYDGFCGFRAMRRSGQ